MPRARSSGALSIESNERNSASPFIASTLVSAAVSVVLPWSTCPIVPTLTCGFVRSNFPFAIAVPSCLRSLLIDHSCRDRLRSFGVVLEFHRIRSAPLGGRTQRGRITEHFSQRHLGPDNHRAGHFLLHLDHAATRRKIADDITHEIFRRFHF